jgi:TolB-like protein/DNA-binding winged helix-turn-helix (wHTH) protein/Tfp pilus assembly protein PilF
MNDPMDGGQPEILRFGVFEVDLRAGELRERGRKVPLQEKPFQVLVALLERDGGILTRDELRQRLWPSGTVVEFDANLNTAMRRLRDALGDSAERPRYVETLPRRGYRFLVPQKKASLVTAPTPAVPALPPSAESKSQMPYARYGTVIAMLIASIALLIWVLHRYTHDDSPHRTLLAVLPFRDLSGAPEQDFLSDGLTEELTTQLGRIDPEHLGVIAPSSVMPYKSRPVDLRQIGLDLGVAYVLECSVRRASDQLFITAELVQISDQTQRWAETYNRPFRDVFNVQRDIARRITESLALNILPGRADALARAATTSTAAYEALLRGRHSWTLGTESGFRSALEDFQNALAADPNYTMAYAGIGKTELSLADYHFVDPAPGLKEADAAISKGLALDSDVPELILLHAAWLEAQHSSPAEIDTAYANAVALDPNGAAAHLNYALFLRTQKRFSEALSEAQKALELDPASPSTLVNAGRVFFAAHDDGAATRLFNKALIVHPSFPAALYFLAVQAEEHGKSEEAIALYQKAVISSGRTPKYLHSLGIAYANVGRKVEARQLLDELRRQAPNRYVDPQYIVSIDASINSNSGGR